MNHLVKLTKLRLHARIDGILQFYINLTVSQDGQANVIRIPGIIYHYDAY